MANWHALTGTLDGNSFRIVYHIAIPSANNAAGINYRTARGEPEVVQAVERDLVRVGTGWVDPV